MNNLYDKEEYNDWLTSKSIDSRYMVGDYTYGKPEIFNYTNDFSNLEIGKFCSIANGTKIIIGGKHESNFITTFPLSTFFNVEHPISKSPVRSNKIVIGNDVWIAQDVTILSGVTIGDGSIVGAGSIVTKNVLPYTFVAGNPTKIIKNRFSALEVEKLLEIKWWTWDIDEIKKVAPLLLSEDISKFIKRYGDIDE